MRIVPCPICYKLYVYRKQLLVHLAMTHPLPYEPLDLFPSWTTKRIRRGRGIMAIVPCAPAAREVPCTSASAAAPATAIDRRVLQLLPPSPTEVVQHGGQIVAWGAIDLPPKKRHLMQIRQEAPAPVPARVREGSGGQANGRRATVEVGRGGALEVDQCDPRPCLPEDQCGGCGRVFKGRRGVAAHRRHCKARKDPPASSSAVAVRSGWGAARAQGFDLNQLPPRRWWQGK